jgi:ribosomal protein S18 acetylase RimI-like enzyme
VWSRTPEVAAWLYEQTMDRAREMGRENGHAEITVEADIYRADEPQRALLTGHAFTNGTTYHRMRIDHREPVAMPAPPPGVVVRRGAWDDASRWTAHELIIECFQGQFGFVVRPHEQWIEYLELLSTFDWSQMTLLEVDGRAVALRKCTDAHLETDDCGYVGMLCVLEEFRGRGLARFLLQDAFAHDAAASRAGTMLDVDTNNPTPALGLYLAVGMKPTLVSEGWIRVVAVN